MHRKQSQEVKSILIDHGITGEVGQCQDDGFQPVRVENLLKLGEALHAIEHQNSETLLVNPLVLRTSLHGSDYWCHALAVVIDQLKHLVVRGRAGLLEEGKALLEPLALLTKVRNLVSEAVNLKLLLLESRLVESRHETHEFLWDVHLEDVRLYRSLVRSKLLVIRQSHRCFHTCLAWKSVASECRQIYVLSEDISELLIRRSVQCLPGREECVDVELDGVADVQVHPDPHHGRLLLSSRTSKNSCDAGSAGDPRRGGNK
mmetsp:Transcript_15428/g.33415  ORF Transcript_15428/g.33415 Transcript_15428/m.33415 type:complete len:260 (-) Transcript_15428:13-792(-)